MTNMIKRLLTITAVIFIYACTRTITQQKTTILSNASFVTATKDSLQLTNSILKEYTPSILVCTKLDTARIYYGHSMIEDDSLSRQLIIGKLISKDRINAIEICLRNNTITFFSLDENNEWKSTGKAKINIGPLDFVEFEDFDGDNTNEIFTTTHPNMNGNRWMGVYHHSAATDSVKYAGAFSTDYKIYKNKRQLRQTYGGSWYMDESKTLYQWQQNRLIPVKKVILAHDTPVDYGSKLTLEYYENSSNSFDGLKLKFKRPYNDSIRKQRRFWDKFFSLPLQPAAY